MDTETIGKLKSGIIEAGLASESEVMPCTPDQVRQVQAACEGTLADLYIEFLQTMGRGAGQYFMGTDIFYPEVLDLNQAACELLVEAKSKLVLPQNAFVFSMHQGYQFTYFIADGTSDPPVYIYIENMTHFALEFKRLSQFLLNQLQALRELKHGG